MHHGQSSWENENYRKYVKNTGILRNQRGNLAKYGGMKTFLVIGKKSTERAKIEWEIKNVWSITKKGHQKFNFGR